MSENNTENNINYQRIRSFVKREGKMAERLKVALAQMGDRYIVSPSEALNLATAYQKTVIEIGSGQGQQLIYAAENNHDTFFIGFEVYLTGVAHTLFLAKKAEVTNFCLINSDVYDAFQLAEFSKVADEIWTFFPDPWPKKRHHKRRLIDDDFANLAQKVLKSQGIWRIATDWEDYANQIADVLAIVPTQRFAGRLLTNFEKKGIDAGRKIYDFTKT